MTPAPGRRFPVQSGNRLPRPVVLLWLAFALFILYAGTIPFQFSADGIGERIQRVPLNPFVSPDTGHRLSLPDLVQNILLFVPFGAMGFLAGRKPALTRIARVTVCGLALSALVEALQLLTSDRVTGLNDVLANTAGAFGGAIVAWQSTALVRAGLARLRREGMDIDELDHFAALAAVVAIAWWQPFDATLDVGTVVAKIRSVQNDIWQFDGLRDEGLSLMLWSLFAITCAEYLSALGESRAGRKAAAIGVVLAAGLEASQVIISSRMPGLWDAFIAATGVVAGAAGWSVGRRLVWPGLWLFLLVAATTAAAVLELWSPFVVVAARDFHTFGWFPFLGYYTRTGFDTLSHVIELALLYFPLGFGVAWLKGDSNRALVTCVLLALGIAAVIEAGQGWIAGRYPDVTDVAMSVAGVWIGFRAYNRQRA